MISDIEKHQIQGAVDRELTRSFVKHGNWHNESYGSMTSYIFSEYVEVLQAESENDHHSEHGTFNELAQVAACCQKMMMQILRREGMPE